MQRILSRSKTESEACPLSWGQWTPHRVDSPTRQRSSDLRATSRCDYLGAEPQAALQPLLCLTDLGTSAIYVHAQSLQLCQTFCNPVDCSPPGSSVHRILKARILEWVAIPFSKRSSWPRDQTQDSCVSWIAGFSTAKPQEAFFFK